jgi:hypothetical protein
VIVKRTQGLLNEVKDYPSNFSVVQRTHAIVKRTQGWLTEVKGYPSNLSVVQRTQLLFRKPEVVQ